VVRVHLLWTGLPNISDFTNQKIAGFDVLGINEEGAWNTPWLVSKYNPNTMFVGLKNIWRSNNIKHPIKDSIQWEKMSF